MLSAPRVSAIVVNWNTRELLSLALESIRREVADLRPHGTGRGGAGETIVVDNASSDGSADMVRAHFPEACLVVNTRNEGFARAVNQAIAVARGDYLLLLNSDAELEPGALSRLLRHLDAHPNVAIVGPQLLNPDGSVQSSRRRFPRLATLFLESTQLQRLWPHHRLLREYYALDRSDHQAQSVDWLVGACLVVRRQASDQVGRLDEQFFMYFEELDWCRRMRAAGWTIAYLPQARVKHAYGSSSELDLPLRDINFNESKCRYVAKYYGRLAATGLRMFLFALLLFELLQEAGKLALGHKPTLRRQRLRHLLDVLRYQAPRLVQG